MSKGLLPFFVVCGAIQADDRLLRALERLAEESSAFQQIAPDLRARETLQQRALRTVQHHRGPHLTKPSPAGADWQTREIVSEFGYALLSESASLREFRKPVSLDGRPVKGSSHAVELLAEGLRSGDDRHRRALLEDFEKLGLIGTVTDFSQSILLFSRRNQDNFEFEVTDTRLIGAERVLIVRYRENSTASLTVWNNGRLVRQPVNGEIWVRESDYLPLRLTLVSVFGEKTSAVREEARIDYIPARFGVVVPASVVHREYRAGQATAENRFTYERFEKQTQPPSNPR